MKKDSAGKEKPHQNGKISLIEIFHIHSEENYYLATDEQFT